MALLTRNSRQYQQTAQTPIEPGIEDRWHQPWSEPVRQRIAGALAIALMVSGLCAPAYTPPPPPAAIVVNTSSSQVIFSSYLIYQAHTEPTFVPVVETVTIDKWNYAWSEPVRTAQFKVHLQPSYTAPTVFIDNIVPTPSGIVSTNSSQVSFKKRLIYQSIARPVFVPEVVTVDKWTYPWSEPVRQKPGLRAQLQQSLIAPVLNPETQVTQNFESRWHYPWSEPVRFRRLPVSEYPVTTADTRTPEFVTADKWAYPWSEPVRFRRFQTSEQQYYAAPVFTPEFITVDKWVYAWSEPVRQKIWLKTHLQQAAIGPVLEPETQISQNFESRWHYAWSEPVRIKPQVPAGEQRFKIQGPVQTPEFLTVDKWIYGWSEPVRQKIGLKTHLQQAYIAPVLNPDTQISQDFESRWHFAWSEPVRFRRFPASEQQSLAFQPPSFETITIDKWGFAWSEPVRQKPGLKANLQQAFIGLTLNPETQILDTYESRWHQSWSEPVKVKLALRTGLQQTQVQGPVQTPEFITIDKWVYPWTDPVRQKIGLKTHLQQALIAPVLNPETQITQDYESRWHQPWSEPVRFRRFATAEQQSYAAPTTSVFEIITVDKWIYRLNEPVRTKIDPRRAIALAAPSAIGPVLNPDRQISQNFESRWHQPWSEPVRFRRFPTAEQQSEIITVPVIEVIRFDKWGFAWSEPVRKKPGLGAWLQQFTTPQTPIFPTGVVRTLNWYSPFNEPVRLKIGLMAALQRFFQTSQEQILADVLVTLSATEINTDSASFGVTVYSTVPVVVGIPTVVVSIKEIPAVAMAAASVEELEALAAARASIAEGAFVPTPVDVSAIITEAGIIIITESGITIVTET